MKKKYIIGNWKIELNQKESLQTIKKITNYIKQHPTNLLNKKIVIAPAIINISSVAPLITGKNIVLAGQDVASKIQGALTGETSVVDLKQQHCRYVLLGHSERRLYHGETDSSVAGKMGLVTQHGLVPIICIGESLQDKKGHRSRQAIQRQLNTILDKKYFLPAKEVIIVYEPLWTIGQSKPLSLAETEKSLLMIRNLLKQSRFTHLQMGSISVLYGGSINAQSARDYWQSSIIDGLLIGRASTSWQSFKEIIKL